MGARRIAGAIVMALMLAACASEQGPTPPTPLPQNDMTGRWMLAAPNAPACGMEFDGAPGQQTAPFVRKAAAPAISS